MRKKAKYTSIARSIVQSVQDKKSWKGIELTGESEETENYVESVDTEDKDTVVMDFEGLTALRVSEKSGPIPVAEYTMEGKLIKVYSSIQEASNATSVSPTTVSHCCRGMALMSEKTKTIFLYPDENIEQRLLRIQQNINNRIYTIHTLIREYAVDGKLIRSWHSVNSVANAFQIPYSKLKTHLKGSTKPIKERFFLTGTEKIEDRLTVYLRQKQEKLERESLIRCAEEALQIDVYTSGGEFLKTCKNTTDCVKTYMVSFADVNNHMLGKALVTKGLMFLPHGSDIQERLKKVRNRKTWKNNL